jgi:Fe-S cluster assembly protein SufD
VITTTAVPEKYVEAFERLDKSSRQQPAWLGTLRQQGFSRFSDAGFPTTHDEDWRFTNVFPIANTAFELALEARVSAADLEAFRVSDFGCQLVFVNGRFAPGLSQIPAMGKVRIASLAQALSSDSESVQAYLGRYLSYQRDAFAALNTAFIQDGAYVYVPKSTLIEQPIYVLYVSLASDKPAVEHPRNLIVVEENSQATIVEDYVSLENGGSAPSFSNTVTELVAGENAVVSHYMLVRPAADAFNISTLRIQQERSSNVATHSLLLSGALVRNNVHPVLAGEGAECLINGLFMANGRQHMDNYMLVEHASPHCNSRQFYNGVLNGHSHGVFHGRIIVHKDAQKTDAKQTNRNLLLSDDAQIDTKPQLEIYADDVKCTHGATIGQVEENALFYLRSRGLDEASAKHLLLLAFANECLDRMNSEQVRNHLEQLVTEWLPENARYAGDRPAEIERNWEEVG